MEWRKERLPIPDAIRKATDAYRSEMDVIGSWISENCVQALGLVMNFDEAYRDFAPWCQENFNFAFSKKKVGMLLTERGLQKSTKDGKRVYVGVAMVSQLTVSQRIKYGKHDENQAPDGHPAAW